MSASPAFPASHPKTPEDVVRAWNDALDRHDLAALANLYADRVVFYQHPMSKRDVLEAKERAFKKGPFHQTIAGPVAVHPAPFGENATFEKESGYDGHMVQVEAHIFIVGGDGGPLLIAEESDEKADAINDSDTVTDACDDAVTAVVSSLPEVKAARKRGRAAADQTHGKGVYGGIGANPHGDGGFIWQEGIHYDDRFETLVFWWTDGHAHLHVHTDEGDVNVAKSGLRTVEQACKP